MEQPPKGFVFVERKGKKVANLLKIKNDTDKFNYLSFYAKDKFPTLPFIARGELPHMGWDIPTRYVVDANKQCWADNAHGGALEYMAASRLLAKVEQEYERMKIRHLLGFKPELLGWMKTALFQGWTPPTTFNLDDYDSKV